MWWTLRLSGKARQTMIGADRSADHDLAFLFDRVIHAFGRSSLRRSRSRLATRRRRATCAPS
jgi:hypothetical protein